MYYVNFISQLRSVCSAYAQVWSTATELSLATVPRPADLLLAVRGRRRPDHARLLQPLPQQRAPRHRHRLLRQLPHLRVRRLRHLLGAGLPGARARRGGGRRGAERRGARLHRVPGPGKKKEGGVGKSKLETDKQRDRQRVS